MGDIKVTFLKPANIPLFNTRVRIASRNVARPPYPCMHAILDSHHTLVSDGQLIPGARELIVALRDAHFERIEVMSSAKDDSLEIAERGLSGLPIDRFERIKADKILTARREGIPFVFEDGHGANNESGVLIRSAQDEDPLAVLVWTVGLPPRLLLEGYTRRLIPNITQNVLSAFKFVREIVET